MGLFDFPAPLFAWMDRLAATALPPWLRLVAWGVLAGAVSMLLYRRISDQQKIRSGKHALSAAQSRLNAFDGELRDAMPLMGNLLRIAFNQVGRVGWPGLVASLPLIFLLSWLSTDYGYTYPPAGHAPEVVTEPRQFRTQWVDSTNALQEPPRILVLDSADQPLADVPMKAPVPVIHKWRWWNLLIGNPAGYLPERAALERITAPLPRKHYLSFGPEWMRTWEIGFFLSLLLVSLGLKMALKIK